MKRFIALRVITRQCAMKTEQLKTKCNQQYGENRMQITVIRQDIDMLHNKFNNYIKLQETARIERQDEGWAVLITVLVVSGLLGYYTYYKYYHKDNYFFELYICKYYNVKRRQLLFGMRQSRNLFNARLAPYCQQQDNELNAKYKQICEEYANLQRANTYQQDIVNEFKECNKHFKIN